MLLRLRLQVGDVDVAGRIAADDHNVEPGHDRAGGIGAMRRARDQADPAMALLAALVIAANRQQPGVPALRARIRLPRDRTEAGDRAPTALPPADPLTEAFPPVA